MKLQSKFILVLVPLLVLPLLLLGLLSASVSSETINRTETRYLQATLDAFRAKDLDRRHQILTSNGLDQVPSFVQLYQKEVAEAAAKIKLLVDGQIFAFDTKGKLVFDTQNRKAKSMEAKWAPVINKMLTDNSPNAQGHLQSVMYQGIRFAPWNWLVFIAVSDEIINQPVAHIRIATVATALISAIIMTLAVGVLFSRLVSKPIQALRSAADKIASLDYPKSIRVTTKDELGFLARDMEKMALDIRTSQEKIKSFSLELESLVEERTRQLQKSRASLDRAQEIAHLGSWEWDLRTNDLVWSDEVFRIFGLKPQAVEPTFEFFMDFVHPKDRGVVLDAVDETLDEGKALSLEHRIALNDGSVRVIREIGELIRDADENPLRLLGTVQDVTELKIVEEERMNREKLQAAIETAGAVCHELNQPLQVIMVELEMLAYKAKDQGIFDRSKAMLEEVKRMSELTAKLQRITKYETQIYTGDTSILDIDKSIT